MAGANGVEAVCLHEFHAALLGAVDGGGAERAVVVMHATASELERFAVQAEAVFGVHFDFANAERRGNGVHDFSSGDDFDISGVESG
jgi:hypothetical protein